MSESSNNNGWNEWSKHVLSELTRLNDIYSRLNDSIQERNEEINDKIQNIQVELATLKIRASMWGAASGTIPVLLFLAIKLLGG